MIFLIVFLILNLVFLAVVIGNVARWPRVVSRNEGPSHSVSVLIPARNEEQNLAACLDSVLLQGACVAEVIVYDDHSTDGTAEVTREYAERESKILLAAPVALPPNWYGKSFACQQLAGIASGDWLLFIDADVRLVPGAVNGMLSAAESYGASFLSSWPGLVTVGVWEKILMPMLNFVVFTLFPAQLSFIRKDRSLGLAHGASILVLKKDYQKLGGHAAVKDQIFEDTALARHWRAKGKWGLCLDGQDVVRVRMYGTVAEIWKGFQKNFFPAFQHRTSYWLFMLIHLLCFWLPFALSAFYSPQTFTAWVLWLSATAVLGIRSLLAFRFHQPWWSVLFHPFAETFLLLLGITSWWRCAFGRGVIWKGRRYLKASAKAGTEAN